jgi:hypothetical protein
MPYQVFSKSKHMNLFNSRAALLSTVAVAASLFFLPHIAKAEIPNDWQTFKGAYFEIGVPPGFTTKPITTHGAVNGVFVVNDARKLEYAVFSPLWDGEAPFKKAGTGEKVVSSNVKKEGKYIIEDIAISAVDGSYVRYVLSQTFVDEANSTRTNKTFGLKLPNEGFGDAKKIYVQWKTTLTQFAD